MRLSRWGRSPYETTDDIEREAAALSAFVTVQAERTDAEVVVLHSKVPAGADLLLRAPSLKLLVTTTSGTDHIDLPAMAKAGVTVCRLPIARRDAVVEATLGMLIWGLRGFGVMDSWADEGRWRRADLPALAPRLIGSSRVGLVGLGVIGRQVAARLVSLGAEVFGVDPGGLPNGVQAASLEAMVRGCDAVSLHCDLNHTTRGIISAEVIKCASPSLVLVNTARGGLVDTQAALAAVQRGGLAGLCLDVFPEEPADLGGFAQHDRVFVSPHAAGYHTGLASLIRRGLLDVVRAWTNGDVLPYSVQ